MMKKILVASLGLAALYASPVAAQSAGGAAAGSSRQMLPGMSHEQLMQWAANGSYCGSMSVVDAQYLPDGRVQVTCPKGFKKTGNTTGAYPTTSGALTGGLAGSGGALAGVIGVVVVAAAAGSGGGSATGSTTTTN